MKKHTLIALVALFLVLLACLAQAQGVAAPSDKADQPATAPSTQPVADETKSFDETIKSLDKETTREEIEAMVKKANENRLKAERQLVAADIKSAVADPDATDAALAILQKDVK